ncbi:YjjG family noncanonical pyrimidine nucleotidase [uncultured Draconibacterium sp.]|uniref:YjjG family noncanonical pyrimidine nucleotidase n=1 Tax=uncultured Draconibacterium sp. TaxID=1573823 RepID=UPI0025E2C9EB|nr:YjjG family noncanonical pyrimidine nucleotidase [uncultured Draconibacterium sp.]
MRKKYTHLFFDLDNTLWDFKTNSMYAMQETFRLLNLEKKGVEFGHFFNTYSLHNDSLWAAYRKKEVTKKELTRQRFQLTFDSLEIDNVDALMMNDMYLKEMPKQSHLIDGAREILDYTKSKGYRLFIITNGFKEVQHEKLKQSGLQNYFEKVFISEEIKMPKPGREIFEHAIKSSNAKKKSSLMIGDDWEVDIRGALNFGIDAVYFNRLKQPKSNSAGDVKIIDSLKELFLVL